MLKIKYQSIELKFDKSVLANTLLISGHSRTDFVLTQLSVKDPFCQSISRSALVNRLCENALAVISFREPGPQTADNRFQALFTSSSFNNSVGEIARDSAIEALYFRDKAIHLMSLSPLSN
ncbi:MAG: hypothetical protein ACI845_000890 [Gammaproteobacteria bacterium]|jgi:hypothetical protein